MQKFFVGGGRVDKIKEVNKHVADQFAIVRMRRGRIHDSDLRMWAMEKSREMQFDEFKASDTWLYKWKKNNRVVSRKITKVYTHKQVRDIPEVIKTARDFVNTFKNKYKDVDAFSIRNTDQSGFNLELLPGRTLEVKGSLSVEATVQSANSLTHSYTIMPLIAASGDLIGPLFIILQEKDGVFGDRVQNTMFKHNDLYVVCSKSGKITKAILEDWFLNVYFHTAGRNEILLVDALTSYKDREKIDQLKPSNVNYTFEMLPPHTTPFAQPLDRYFFRPYKAFTRRISEYLSFNFPEVKLHTRDTILKIQVVVYNTFRSPRFKEFLKYSWALCGYIDERMPHVSPMEYCFQDICQHRCSLCPNKSAFIRCAWCSFYFCFQHFFFADDFHYCRQYNTSVLD